MTPHAAVIGGRDAKNAPPGRADQGHGVTSTGTLSARTRREEWPWYSTSYLVTEIYTVFKPGQSQALLVGFRTWIDTHTDQVIISGSLLLAHRQQPLPDPHLRHHRSPWN